MPMIEINDFEKIGVIRDEPAYQLPPEAFTLAENMRSEDGGLIRMPGDVQVFGTPPVAPHFALSLSAPSQTYWLYTSLTKGYVYDGVSHTNITRQSAGVDVDYTVTETRDWNGTILAGIPILNNGADVPQFWGTPSAATKLANLTNWPAALRAKRIIAFGAYLVAINILDGANAYPHLVRWSSETPGPGSLPASWDYTDPTVDAGAYDLPDVNSGRLLDAMTLGGRLVLYKGQSTWIMRRVGGRALFSFESLFETVGILTQRCVAITPDGSSHIVATGDDIIIHSGQGQPKSVVNKRLRNAIFNDLDTDHYVNSFCFTDQHHDEVWFCYPQQGQIQPNRAVVINTRTGALTESDVSWRNVGAGVIEETSDEVWDTGVDTWDSDPETWSTSSRHNLVFVDTANTKFRKANTGLLRNGAGYPATLQRTSLSLIGKKRTGEWIVNHEIRKMFRRLWPKINGGPVRVRIGYQQVVGGSVTWGAYQAFDPATQVTVDDVGSGRAVAIEFSTQDSVHWKVYGYQIDITTSGRF